MSTDRRLPDRHNPLLEAEHTPQLEILIERRRLGQTDLAVKPGQVGIANATQEKNLGKFDYAHLRAPLPKDLKGSGIFSLTKGTYPESYFLMRRSADGYISATGMFKAAFPWASNSEEAAERKYHKTLESAGHEEVAGNVWISPEQALELADEYDMRTWVVALLDPAPIDRGTKERGSINTPPRFMVPEKDRIVAPSPVASTRRRRELRSSSPSKTLAAVAAHAATPGRKIATPRKPRTTRSKKTDGALLENGTQESIVGSTVGSVEPESVNGDMSVKPPTAAETVTVAVDETTTTINGIETTETQVRVEMPADYPDLPLPGNPEEMIETAKRMVEEANKIEGERVGAVKSLKRKADDLDVDTDEARMEVQPAKKVRKLEEEVKKQQVRTRAYVGAMAVTFLGAAITWWL